MVHIMLYRMVTLVLFQATTVTLSSTIHTGENCRARSFLTTIGMLILLVSSTTTAMSTIPTEYYDRRWIETIICTKIIAVKIAGHGLGHG